MNNNTADPQTPVPVNPLVSNIPVNQQNAVSSGIHGKESEAVTISASETVQEVSKVPEIPKEVESAGITAVSGTIELPPDVKKLGVTQSGASVPVTTTTALPQVVLPISDQQVMAGLHAKITSAFRWLSAWCIKKLKKAHIALKVIHGKIIRIRN